MSDKEHDKTDEKSLLNKDEKEKAADGAIPDGQTPVDDESKVKLFIGNGGAEDVKVEVAEAKSKEKPSNEFTGLSKEELEKYSDDPFWVKVRWVLLILFWVAWFGMLAAAIVIIVLAPKCPPRPPMEWYQKSVAYQVYPRSYKDSDKDGVGDLKGIHNKLDHLKEIDGKTLWINSILKSNNFEFGNAVVDFKAVDSHVGTLEDFKHMRIAAHKKGMKIIMDFVPNHSSKNHTWFLESAKNNDANNEYRDYYVWADPAGNPGGSPQPPNNWKSIYGGSAWTYVASRKQYYLHQYFKEQPDLNFRNPKVKDEIKSAIKFWFDQGVDGLNLVGAPYLVESNFTRNDEPPMTAPPGSTNDYYSQNHTLTKYQPETFKLLTEWRSVADSVQSDTDKPRALIVEGDDSVAGMLLNYQDKKGAHMVVDPALTTVDQSFDNQKVTDILKNHMDNWPKSITTMWMLGNADRRRVASRVKKENLKAIQMLFMTLPGTPTTYYGEEIAMTNTPITKAENKDPLGKIRLEDSRDGQRTPMQWSNERLAGFTDGTSTWLPINANYTRVNLMSEKAAGAGHSHFEVYLDLAKLREKESFLWGELKFLDMKSKVVAFTRQAVGFHGYLVIINFDIGTSPTLNFRANNEDKVAEFGKVVANTANFGNHNDFQVNKTINLGNIRLNGGEGVVFEWAPGEVKN